MPSNNLLTHDGYPAVKTSDGKHMTEYSITVTDPRMNGGKPTNIPSLWKGKVVDEDTAVNNAIASKKEYRSFDSIDSAVSDSIKKSSAGGANAPEKYAMGGNVQAETDEMLADGGIMQQGDTVDPVSGNDVPPGAMQEEVRDDIDAKLSEGEFVLPADVVRFIGLSTLMKMRDKAKEGLQKMQDIGQMGNAEEVPDAEALHGEESEMDDSSFGSEIDSILSEDSGGGEEREYAIGGYVVPERQALYRNAPIRGFEMVPMSNDLGQTIYIPFINGVAQLNVPAGYKAKSSVAAGEPVTAAPTTPAVVAPASTGGDGGGDGCDGGGGGGNTDGSAKGGGQGNSNDVTSAALAGLAFSKSLPAKALSVVLGVPATTVAGFLSNTMLDQQISSRVAAVDAMTDVDTGMLSGQIATVSDESGNISTVSNQSITDAFDMANFGVTSSQVSADSSANSSQAAETGMSTNAQGQTVSSDASIAAQDAANFGGGGGGGDNSAGMGGASEGSAGSTAGTSDSPDGPDGSNAFNTGGFVSKRKKSVITNKKSLASRK